MNVAQYAHLLDREYKIIKGFTIDTFEVNSPSFYYGTGLSLNLPVRLNILQKYFPQMKNFYPISILPGISMINITFFDFIDSPVQPYFEFVISIPISNKSKLFSFLDLYRSRNSFCVLDIYQSTRLAINHGDILTGYPHNHRVISGSFNINNDSGIIDVNMDNLPIIKLNFRYNRDYRIIHNRYPTLYEKDRNINMIEMDIHGKEHKAIIDNIEFLNDCDLTAKMGDLIRNNQYIMPRFYSEILEVNPVNKSIIND
jgi:hypothetical protein